MKDKIKSLNMNSNLVDHQCKECQKELELLQDIKDSYRDDLESITVIRTDFIVEYTNVLQEMFCFMFVFLISIIIAVIKTPIIFLLKSAGDTLLFMAAISCRVLSLIFGLFFVTFCLGMPDKTIMLMLYMAEYFEFPRIFNIGLYTEVGWPEKEFIFYEDRYERSSLWNRLYFKV